MINPIGSNERRREQRVGLEFDVKISVGSQITVLGTLKDLSLSSAFIKIKSNIFLNAGDEINLTLEPSPETPENNIQVLARVCRVVLSEGFAVYFLNMDENSLKNIKKLLKEASK